MEIAKTVSDFLEMPYDTAMDIPKIVMLGAHKIYIENYSSLIEYKKEDIKLKYKTGIIEIYGNGFEIKGIGEGNIVISGKISGVKLI